MRRHCEFALATIQLLLLQHSRDQLRLQLEVSSQGLLSAAEARKGTSKKRQSDRAEELLSLMVLLTSPGSGDVSLGRDPGLVCSIECKYGICWVDDERSQTHPAF